MLIVKNFRTTLLFRAFFVLLPAVGFSQSNSPAKLYATPASPAFPNVPPYIIDRATPCAGSSSWNNRTVYSTTPFGNGSITRSNSGGNTYTSQPFGNGTIIRSQGYPSRSYTTTPFGSGNITRDSSGNSWTTQPFGNGSITRDSKGNTYTTTPFGSGSITRGNDGRSWTTSPFGNSTITREN